jgi:hypothetical protein
MPDAPLGNGGYLAIHQGIPFQVIARWPPYGTAQV